MPFSGSGRAATNDGCATIPESGTALATYSSSKSHATFHETGPRSTWGGARNRAGRVSASLSLNQAAGIIEAAQFAVRAGLPFNRHLTIHWERAGVPDSEAARATGRFLKMASDWVNWRARILEKQSKKIRTSAYSDAIKSVGSLAWAWVRENGDGKGSHVHVLLHVPSGLELGTRQRGWLRLITGSPYRVGTIRTARIGGTARASATAPAAYRANLAVIVDYVLKGASPDAARSLGLDRIEAGGRIIGKRAGWSQNIGRAARVFRSMRAGAREASNPLGATLV